MSRNKVVGFGYVGLWNDGDIGWNVPRFIEEDPKCKRPQMPSDPVGAKQYLCKITIERVEIKGRRKTRTVK